MDSMVGKKKNKSQADVVLFLLKTHKRGITRATAAEHGVFCLPERIRDLRERGCKIVRKDESGMNRYGHHMRYGRYILIKDKD